MSRLLIIALLCTSSLLGYIRTPTRLQSPGWWGGVDYLTVWRKQRDYPPLVTTSPAGTGQGNAGKVGLSTTEILFGQHPIAGSPVAGLQGEFGFWISKRIGTVVSAYTFGYEKIKDTWYGDGSGVPIIARPYINAVANVEVASFASFPNTFTGGVEVDTMNRIWGFDLCGVFRLHGGLHFTCDVLGGVTYMQLDDSCDIYGNSSLNNTTAYRSDQFWCGNNYYAGIVGFNASLCKSRLRADVCGKFGLGNVVQTVEISGVTFPPNNAAQLNGGLLALPSNIGSHSRNRFEVNTSLQAVLRCSIIGHLHAALGYRYWRFPKVALAGEVINRQVNQTYLNGGALVGAANPILAYDDTSFSTQSLTTGIYFVY